MIEELKVSPNTMVGFRTTGEITKKDFDQVVLPAVTELVNRTDKLNFLLVIDEAVNAFSIGMWLNESMHSLNIVENWNRAAIVSHSGGIKEFTGVFSKVSNGEFRGFRHNELGDAILWVGEQHGDPAVQVFAKEDDGEN